jgi:hypothetical protein
LAYIGDFDGTMREASTSILALLAEGMCELATEGEEVEALPRPTAPPSFAAALATSPLLAVY